MDKLDMLITALTTLVAQLNNNNSKSAAVPLAQPPKKYSLHDWLDVWFEEYKKPKLSKSSLRSLEIVIRLHIKRNIADVPLSTLTALDIVKALNKVRTGRMKEYTYMTYHDALTTAFENDLLENDIMQKVKPYKHERKQGRALTLAEQKKFLKIIKGKKLESLYRFYLLTGARKSEILTLKWIDIDYKNNRILLLGTKTEKSVRFVPLFSETKSLLVQIPKNGEYVFNLKEYNITNSFRYLAKKYKLDYTIHSLRHTFATRCLECGINIKLVQKWLGHTKLETTSKIYSHILPDFEQAEMTKFKL